MKSKIKKIFVKAAALGIMSVMCIQLAGCDSTAQQQGNTQSETSAAETSVSEAQDSENTSDKTDENISSEKETEVFD
ncbi:MAG: hypothetical protein IJ583_09480, partial [Firmicutes bacterium]|nr:hypothetical protein [Bacillota bacterium]